MDFFFFRTAVIGASLDVLHSVYNSLVLFAVLGVMAKESGVPVHDVVQAGMTGA